MSGPWPNGWRWRWSPAAAAAWWERCSTWAWSGATELRTGAPLAALVPAAAGTGDRGLLQAHPDRGPGYQRHHRGGAPRQTAVPPGCCRPSSWGTILTHLCGGSAGREGAALQMGGTIGRCTGTLFNLDDRDLRTAVMAGMAAFFSALFGTPLAATVFAMMVISIGVVYHVAFIPWSDGPHWCPTGSPCSWGWPPPASQWRLRLWSS